MNEAHILGETIERISGEKGLTISDLSKVFDCPEDQIYMLLKGRALPSYAQLTALSVSLGVPIDRLLACQYQNSKNAEILGFIDNYIDISDAVSYH